MFQHLVPSSYARPGRKNRIIEKAIRQGVEVIPEILHDDLTEDEAMELEKLYISVLGRADIKTGILANHTDGGEGRSGYKPSTETRVKMGSANRGKLRPESTKKKTSETMRGRQYSTDRKTAMMFGKWDKNPAWLIADFIRSQWLECGKPGWRKLKTLSGIDIPPGAFDKIKAEWNPAEDPAWITYRETRQSFSA